ncbi:hypothetical protein EVA_14019 [gut metagenome]|uniref:Uncharacterized protein n=1 Tax=gut metagenome TaxID=749906 RepID=J9FTP3_9ZZZZ
MTNISFGQHGQNAFHKAQAGTQDRHNSNGAFNFVTGGFAQRSGYSNLLYRDVLSCFKGQQHCYLANSTTEGCTISFGIS